MAARCLAGRASDYAALVRRRSFTLLATIPTGDAPGWAETADNGRLSLIANSRSDDLSVISIADRKEILRVPIGDAPKHITVTTRSVPVIDAVKRRGSGH
jgi:YVTN family beta-propeller protein